MKIECKPWILKRFYEVQWFRVKTDLAKLAKKHWIGGDSTIKLAKSLGLSKITIEQHLRKIRNQNGLATLNLSDYEKQLIRENWEKSEVYL